MADSHWPVSEDAIKQAIDRANVLLEAATLDRRRVDDVINEIAGLAPRDLVHFDERSRSYLSGLAWHRVPGLRGVARGERRRSLLARRHSSAPDPTDASMALWHVLAAVSGDGFERERAVRSAPLTALSVRLLGIRCIDWVQEVRDAALERLDECPSDVLVPALPLFAQLAAERSRGQLLDALIDARLSDADLRSACTAEDVLTRRVAWRRLAARGVLHADELRDLAARDEDVLVRAVAAKALSDIPADDRRTLAGVLIDDTVGWVAVLALAALVELDGAAAIRPALAAPTAALRRAARDWARIRDVDARSVYLERLGRTPDDTLALVALAEMGAPEDLDVFRRMLTDDRTRVRAAGLRGLARVDRPAARTAALDALETGQRGRVAWAAAELLRDGVPSNDETHVLAQVALDPSRAPGQRFRALSLIRPARWLHLAVMLEVHEQAVDDDIRSRLRRELNAWNGARLTRAPEQSIRARIERLLPVLDTEKRRSVEFVLRTSS